MDVFKVFATLGFNADEFTSGLSDAERRLGGIEQTFGRAGRTLTTGLTVPLAGIGVAALKAGADFELSMNQVRALTSATAEEFAALRDMAKQLGATTQFSASEAADAMGFLAMAGQNTDQILGSMPGTLLLAAAAQLDMASAADIVTNIMAGFGMEVEDLDGAVDVLVQAFTSANTDLPQLAEAMKYAGPVANAAGVQFEQAAAAMALMGNAGIQGSMAGTSLRGAISRILNPTARASELMAGMGLSSEEAAEMMEALEGSTDDLPAAFEAAGLSFTDAAGRLLPLDEIIQQLEPHANDAGLFMELFGQRAGPAMAALVSQGSDALRELTGSLEDSAGRAKEVADVQMEGLTGAMRLFKSAAEAVLIAIADSGLLEAATNFLTTIAGWIQNLSEVNPIILRAGTVLGGLLAALGPVLWAVGSFAGAVSNLIPLMRLVPGLFTGIRVAIGALTGPVGWIITAVGLIATAFATDFLGIRTLTVQAWDAIRNAFSAAGDFIASTMGRIRETFTNWWSGIRAFFSDIPGQMLGFGRDIVTGLADGIRNSITNAVEAVTGLGSRLLDNFKGMLGIESPSKVFYGYGQDITEGLAQGVEAGTPRAVSAVQSLANAVAGAYQLSMSGAFTADNIIGGVTGGLDGREAIAAINERLETLREARNVSFARSRIGAWGAVSGTIDNQIAALQDELRRLNMALRETTQQQVRSTEVQTARFGRAVSEFDSGVRGLTLAGQRQ